MKRTLVLVVVLGCVVSAELPALRVTGVFNDADPRCCDRVAAGSVVQIGVWGDAGRGGPTTAWLVTGGNDYGLTVLAENARTVRGLVPREVPEGEAILMLERDGVAAPPKVIRVVGRDPGLYRQVTEADEGGAVVRYGRPARPGQTVALWTTGLGAAWGGVEVRVGGRTAEVVEAGPQVCCEGIERVVIRVPEGAEGCHVPVVVRSEDGEGESNYIPLPVSASGEMCEDPTGLPREILEKLDGGEIRYGLIEAGLAAFGTGRPAMLPPSGSCAADGTAGWTVHGPFGNAGDALAIRAPEGTRWMTRQDDGTYAGRADESATGTYTIENGSGGESVGGFSTQVTMHREALAWTNADEVGAVVRGAELEVRWLGGQRGELILIQGGMMGGTGPMVGIQRSFVCVAPGEAGRFAIPAEILWNSRTVTATQLGLSVGARRVHRIAAAGMDLIEYFYGETESVAVPLR